MGLHDWVHFVLEQLHSRATVIGTLSSLLQDTKTVVGKLELVVGVIIHIIFIFFYLIIFNVGCSLLMARAARWKGMRCT